MVLLGAGMLLSRHVLLPLVALACMAAPSGAVLVFLGVMMCIRGIHRPSGHARWPALIAFPIALVAMIDALILFALVVTGKLEGL